MIIESQSQRDPRWQHIKLGFSSTKTIGSHGCTITAIAMWLSHYYKKTITPLQVNDRLKEVDGYAQTNLVIWSKLEQAFPGIKFEWRGYTYDNNVVLKNLPCLVEVDGQRIGGIKHWVLYTGDKKMADPWYGNIKDTNYYAPTGFAVLKFLGLPDEPDDTTFDWLISLAHEYKKPVDQIEGWVRESIDKSAKVEGYREAILKLETKVVPKLNDEVLSLTNQRDSLNVQVETLTRQLEEANKPIPVFESDDDTPTTSTTINLSEGGDDMDTKTKNVLLESLKEPGRLILLSIIPLVITYLTDLNVEWAAVAILILRFVDKWLHEVGKEAKNETMVRGLTQF